MKINSKDFRVPPGEKVNFRDWPTIVKPFRESKEQYQELLREHVERLSSLQQLLYAVQPLCFAADFSGDGRCRQGRRHPARHVRRQSARLPPVLVRLIDALQESFSLFVLRKVEEELAYRFSNCSQPRCGTRG
jgi:hypothetical protein